MPGASGGGMPPATVAAQNLGGATYFYGPGQGMGAGAGPGFGPIPGGGGPRTAAYPGAPGGRPDGRGRPSYPPGRAPIGQQFMQENLREELAHRSALIQAQLDPEQQEGMDLPRVVRKYHSLYPLEDLMREDDAASCTLGVRSSVFKGIHAGDGRAYALRRIDSRQVIPTAELAAAASEAVDRWSPLAGHPHVVTLREAFV
eukprot:jgi/Mesen1/10039/ME000073S09319